MTGNISHHLLFGTYNLCDHNFGRKEILLEAYFLMPGVPWPMKIILAPIELLGLIIKPFSLMIRLYANISAGHIVLMSLIALIFIFKNWIDPACLLFWLFLFPSSKY